MRCLVLNNDWSFLNITSSFDALCLGFEEKADVLKAYDKPMRSQYLSVPTPAIIALRKYKDISKKKRNFAASTRNVIIRDGFRCAYCGRTITFANGTKDHVIPACKGGKTVMSNLVAACRSCNARKDSHSLAESGMKLLFQPRDLTNEERLKCLVKTISSKERNVWIDWLKENGVVLW